jgi:hypothetical protein
MVDVVIYVYFFNMFKKKVKKKFKLVISAHYKINTIICSIFNEPKRH